MGNIGYQGVGSDGRPDDTGGVFRLGASPSYMGTDWINCTATDLYKNIAIHQNVATASGIHSNVNTALTIDNGGTTTNPGTVTSLIYYITYNIITV